MYSAVWRVDANTVDCFRKDSQELRACDKRCYGMFRWVFFFFGALRVFPCRLLLFGVLLFQPLVLLLRLVRSALEWYHGSTRIGSWDAGLEQTAVVGVELIKLEISAIASNESHFQVLRGSSWLWEVE